MVARKPIIGANWKCNPATLTEVNELITSFNTASFNEGIVDVAVAASSIHVGTVKAKLDDKFKVAAQNCGKSEEGAFTGEVSAGMLVDFGVEYAIIGHSERRHKFGETNEEIAEKIAKAQEAGLKVIFCVGETLEERKEDMTDEVLKTQVKAVLDSVTDWTKIVIAYEPVWAIGTGIVATVNEAASAHYNVRKVLFDCVSPQTADSQRIIYGGSVSPDNCYQLIKCNDIDGFLVGGASLKPSFMEIVAKVQAQYTTPDCRSLGVNCFDFLKTCAPFLFTMSEKQMEELANFEKLAQAAKQLESKIEVKEAPAVAAPATEEATAPAEEKAEEKVEEKAEEKVEEKAEAAEGSTTAEERVEEPVKVEEPKAVEAA